MGSARFDKSALLELLNERKAWECQSPCQPYVAPKYHSDNVNTAVQLHAQAEKSDPFAGPRMRLHLAKGYELPSDIIKQSRSRLHSSPAPSFEGLAGMKKRLDVDAAWKSHTQTERRRRA